ncbi:MAG: hypothetical protein H0X36_04855 [Sphingomonadaceae bacterium]|nr:hypothetical protein [Sphingomonadaceae bacterium]
MVHLTVGIARFMEILILAMARGAGTLLLAGLVAVGAVAVTIAGLRRLRANRR